MLSPIRASLPVDGLLRLDAVTSRSASQLSERRGEPEWLREQRSIAAGIYEELPVPRWERGIRGWWTTDPSDLKLERLSAMIGAQAPERAARHRGAEGQAGLILQRDGAVIGEQLDPALAEQGVIFADLSRAVREREDLIRAHLSGLVKPGEDKFVALNNALWAGGVLIYVPPGVEVAVPLRARFELATPESAIFVRTLLIAGAGSRVTYVEDYSSPRWAEQGLHSGIVEVYAREGAEVHFVTIHNWGESVFDFAQKRAVVQRDAKMHWVTGFMGGALTKAVIETRMREAGARVEASGIFFGSGKQHLDIISRTFHEAPHTQGDVLFKGIVRDAARSALEGLIRVEKGAQQTTSYLSDHTLQLSREAKSNAIPSLEIEANDVRVSHGATVGMIDEEQLYYLMTRGLDRATAERTIVSGFFEPVLARIPVAGARQGLVDCIERKMRGTESAI